jgi:twitching motility protein PilT
MHKLTYNDTLNFAKSIITQEEHETLLKTKNLDFSFSYANRRIRINISFQLNNYMIVLRLLTADIPKIDNLNLPDIYKNVTKL